jgi:acyl carrier protein
MSIRLTVVEELEKVAAEQKRSLTGLTDDTPLVAAGLDSLCFAILVARLEDRLHRDPFSESDEVAFPVTLKDLVALYETPAQKSD